MTAVKAAPTGGQPQGRAEVPAVPFLRRRVAVSATLVLVGILTSAAVDSTLGGWLTIPALVYLLWALHRFGRTGPS